MIFGYFIETSKTYKMKITELIVYTSNLSAQKEFYVDVLNIPLNSESENHIDFIIGNSLLRFKYKLDSKPYHFAINISSNKEYEALIWLKERVTILKHFDDEIIDFINWNAKAIYFYDADRNIVEFIARKNLKTDTAKVFNSNLLLEISEIGVPVNNIEQVYNTLHTTCDLGVYFGNFDKFCAIGEERGLFIVIDKNSKNWFPTNDKAFASDFSLKILANMQQYSVDFSKGELTIA